MKIADTAMPKKTVNLLQERTAPPTFWERAYEWVTNSARLIVIFVEIIVLAAFGWRFWLDRQLNDLNEEIERKGEVLKNLSEQEAEIRLIQAKVNTFGELWDQSSNLSPVFRELNSYIPSGVGNLRVSLQETIREKTMQVSGEVEREKIDELENKLKDASNYFSNVILSEIGRESAESEEYAFTIKADIIYGQQRDPLSNK